MQNPDLPHQQEATLTREGVSLHLVRAGEAAGKPPVVFCHGLTDNGLCWYRTAKALASDFDLIMLDARNHGLSGDGTANVKGLAADVSSVAEQLGFAEIIVIGHSVGAAVAAAFAADYPTQSSKVILEDPPWRTSTPTPDPEKEAKQHKAFAAYVRSMRGKTEADIIAMGQAEHPTWHPEDFPAWAASKKQVREQATKRLDLGDWHSIVPNISCPSLLIFGDQGNSCDGIVNRDVAAEVSRINPMIETRHIAGAGHNLRREQFEGYIEAVRSFLTEK